MVLLGKTMTIIRPLGMHFNEPMKYYFEIKVFIQEKYFYSSAEQRHLISA